MEKTNERNEHDIADRMQWRSQGLSAWASPPEGRNEEENEKSLRKNNINLSKFEERMRKVKVLPTRDCEAGYGPDRRPKAYYQNLRRICILI